MPKVLEQADYSYDGTDGQKSEQHEKGAPRDDRAEPAEFILHCSPPSGSALLSSSDCGSTETLTSPLYGRFWEGVQGEPFLQKGLPLQSPSHSTRP